MKILVIKFRHIGDVLLLTPLFENLRLHFCNAQIDVAINAESVDMLEYNPFINNILIYDRDKIKSQKGIKRLIAEWNYFKFFFHNHYDIVIHTTEGDRGALIAFLSRASKVLTPKIKSLFRFNSTHVTPPYKGHIIEGHLDFLRLLNKDVLSKRVLLVYKDSDWAYVQNLGIKKPYIHIHPLSRWQFKCIDDALMAKIIDYCQDKLQIPVVLSASPAKEEQERIEHILKLCLSTPINIAGKITLKQCAALSHHAEFYIGVDTANTHIAAAMDTPVIAFFVASAVFHWGAWDNSLWECPYTNSNGVQKMGKHTLFVKNTALSDQERMSNLKAYGTFNCANFDFSILQRELNNLLHKN